MAAKKVKVNEGGVVVAVVRSTKGDSVYEVRKHAVGLWTCTCMAYRFTKGEIGKKFPCKHMRRAWNLKRPGVKNEDWHDVWLLAPEAL